MTSLAEERLLFDRAPDVSTCTKDIPLPQHRHLTSSPHLSLVKPITLTSIESHTSLAPDKISETSLGHRRNMSLMKEEPVLRKQSSPISTRSLDPTHTTQARSQDTSVATTTNTASRPVHSTCETYRNDNFNALIHPVATLRLIPRTLWEAYKFQETSAIDTLLFNTASIVRRWYKTQYRPYQWYVLTSPNWNLQGALNF